MAGGIGSRLAPMSTPEHPKQFLDVLDCGKTLIQLTVERFLSVCPIERFWVVTSLAYKSFVRQQLPQLPESHILLEPVARNTAPCIAYACRRIARECPDADVVVTPSDAYVADPSKFAASIAKALDFLKSPAGDGSIVTLGITPSRPETAYGYIRLSCNAPSTVVKALEFKEKPDYETAKNYLAAGNYVWNAGVFIWNVAFVNAMLAKYASGISAIMDSLEPYLGGDGEQEALERLFPMCEKISIDYAVMEKAQSIFTIAENPGWDDLGSWASVLSHLESLGKTDKLAYWREILKKIDKNF